jgi:hypothetical protein
MYINYRILLFFWKIRVLHQSFSSFSGSAWEVAVLRMLHLIILHMSQDGQSFTCSISHSSLERAPRDESLDHLAATIGHRHLVYDHMYMSEIRVPSM